MLYSEEIIRYLGRCKAYPQSEEPSDRTRKLDVWEKRLRNIGVIFLVPVLSLAVFRWFHLLPWWMALAAQALGLLCILFWAASVAVLPFAMVCRAKSWNTDLTEYEVRAEIYMKSLAEPLMICSPEQLKYVDARLSERYEGITGRLTIVFGEGVFKAGVLAVLLDTITRLGKVPEQVNTLGLTLKPGILAAVGVYFAFFFIVMPVSVRIMALRYPFQRRIIKVALDLKELAGSAGGAVFYPAKNFCRAARERPRHV